MHRDYEKQLRNYHQAKWNEELIFESEVRRRTWCPGNSCRCVCYTGSGIRA